MKKTFYLIALLLLSVAANAQRAILFKFKYLPAHTYKSNIKMDMDMHMVMKNDSSAAGNSPVSQPVDMKMDAVTAVEIKTGSLKQNKTFPFTMTHGDVHSVMVVNGKETPTPKNPMIGKSIYGKCTADGKLHVDSMSFKGMPEQFKAVMTEMMNKAQGQIKFPEKPLAIGDAFTQEVPFNMPASGIKIAMMIKTIYKLIAVKDNLAYFDTDMSLAFNLDSEKNGTKITGKGTGKGTGKLTFSMAKSYPIAMTSDFTMEYSMNVKTMSIAANMKMVSDVKNNIIANLK